MKELSKIQGVQFITHETEKYSYLDAARMALEGGCRWIQLRMKNVPVSKVEQTAWKVKEMCRKHEAVFIIDDHVDVAKSIQADGVHLGKNDMSVREARQILGNEAIIGGTANTFDDVVKLYQDGADYIGCGPFRYTTTKQNLAPILGIEGYTKIITHMKNKGIELPLVAIGGITYEDIPTLLSTGIDGIALSGSMLKAENPVVEMKQLIQIFKTKG